MIRNEREYKEALSRLEQDGEVIAAQRRTLVGRGLSEEEVGRALGPVLSFSAQLEEEVEWYEKVRRRDFEVIDNLSAVGTLLIALRIANGLSQKELADKLGVSEAQVSRDERNEYHGVSVERAQRILDAMGETLTTRVADKPLAIA
ncbi:MAG: helix-turn-helix transcriptional regulator [Rubrobacteraceae bacterium]|jgi:DNA-binding XRE family transcriptional regulator